MSTAASEQSATSATAALCAAAAAAAEHVRRDREAQAGVSASLRGPSYPHTRAMVRALRKRTRSEWS